MASGMPCPLIFSEPKRAISPTSRLPTTGMIAPASPSRLSVIWTGAQEKRPNQKMLVAKAISFNSSQAPNAPPVPTTAAAAVSTSMRRSAL